ncbi:MAG: excalibur calcium-binding domain-containing protein [Candidatus Sericytochromatia bacterium]
MLRALLAAAAIAAAAIGTAPLAGAAPTPSPSPTPSSSSLGPPYADCAAAIAAGKSNIPISDPAYKPEWDHDGDGFACESSDDSE